MNSIFHDRWPWLVSIGIVLSGCGPAPPPLQNISEHQQQCPLAQDQKVTLINEDGDVALVETGDGQRIYVALGLLKHRDTSKLPDGETYTHTVVRDSFATATPSSQPPQPLPPRSITEIDLEQKSLNGVFLTEKSRKLVIAPRDVAKFLIHEETGERAWHAYECVNPQCPGEKHSGFDRHVFIHVAGDTEGHILCPACTAERNLAAESREQIQQWGRLVRVCELPETLRRRKQLDAERRQAIEAMQRQSAGQ
jgi:hypothetical protein